MSTLFTLFSGVEKLNLCHLPVYNKLLRRMFYEMQSPKFSTL